MGRDLGVDRDADRQRQAGGAPGRSEGEQQCRAARLPPVQPDTARDDLAVRGVVLGEDQPAVTDRRALGGGGQPHPGTDRGRQRLRQPVDPQPCAVQQMQQRALLQQPGLPARTGRRYGAQLPHPGRQSGRLGIDHAGRCLLPEPVPRLIGRRQPPRSRSASRSSNSCAPPVIRSARRSARRRAASGSAGPADGTPSAPARFSACSTERLRRPSSHSPAQSGTSPAGRADSPDAQTSSSPSACLHGNFRLGQLHLYAGPVMSITVRYGLLPLPLHCPHTAPEPSHPPPDHGAAEPSLLPALRDASSGARASTCSTVQRATGAVVRKGSPP